MFRDYAPISNIVQSGGRCNRSFGGEIGDVVVLRLAEPEDGNTIPSLVIHGSDGGDALPLLRETGYVLRRHAEAGCTDESTMVSDTVGEFYESLFDGELESGSEWLAEAVSSASMSELEGEHMIEEIRTTRMSPPASSTGSVPTCSAEIWTRATSGGIWGHRSTPTRTHRRKMSQSGIRGTCWWTPAIRLITPCSAFDE